MGPGEVPLTETSGGGDGGASGKNGEKRRKKKKRKEASPEIIELDVEEAPSTCDCGARVKALEERDAERDVEIKALSKLVEKHGRKLARLKEKLKLLKVKKEKEEVPPVQQPQEPAQSAKAPVEKGEDKPKKKKKRDSADARSLPPPGLHVTKKYCLENG